MAGRKFRASRSGSPAAQEHARRAGHRLHDAGRDGLGPVQGHEAFEIVGEFRPVLGQAFEKALRAGSWVWREMIDARQKREDAAVVARPPTEMPPKPTP